MKYTEFEKLTPAELRKKEKSKKEIAFSLIILSVSSLYFPVSSYYIGEKLELLPLVILACLVVGLFSVISDLRIIKKVKSTKE